MVRITLSNPSMFRDEPLKRLYFELNMLGFERGNTISLENKGEFISSEKIKRIDISDIPVIPNALAEFKNVKELTIRSMDLRNIPGIISQIDGLLHLHIFADDLEEIDDQILNLKLRELTLVVNRIKNYPKGFETWVSKIRQYLVSFHGSFPDSFKHLVERSSYQEIPIYQYEKIVIDQINKLCGRELIIDGIIPGSLRIENGHVIKLNLSGLGFDRLPRLFSRLKKITHLDLSKNEFQEIPASVFSLKNLEILRMDQNLLEEVPWRLSELKWLRKINFSANQIRKLPGVDTFQKRLVQVDLSYNQLESVPQGIFLNHREVFLNGNPLKNLKT